MNAAKIETETSNTRAAGKPGAARPDHVFLVDGSGYIFRAYHALPPMNRPDGTPVNAVYGFTNMLMKLVADTDAEYIAVIFDTARKTFRNEIYEDYKANRPPPPEDLIPQFDLIREAVRAFALPSIEKAGFEADDLIATYARAAAADGHQVTVVSSDKDLMQLVGDGITMMDPMKGVLIGPEQVAERFGVAPNRVIDVQALAGDSTDNVPGVPGIGEKSAGPLIRLFGDLDTLLSSVQDLDRFREDGKKKLAEIENEVFEIAGEKFKLNSAAEVGKILFDGLNLPGGKKDQKKNQWVVNASVLEELAGMGHEVPRLIVDWRFLSRVYGNIAEKLAENSEAARISRKLVTLRDDVPVDEPYDSFALRPRDPDALIAFLTEQGFGSIIARVKAEFAAEGRPVEDTAAQAEAADEAGYALVQDEAALQAWVDAAMVAGTVAVDTETTSLDSLTTELVGVSLALDRPVNGARACYIPLGHMTPRSQGTLDLGDGGGGGASASEKAPKQIALKKAVAALKPMLEDCGVLKIGHNIKYDSEVLARHGIHVGPVDDTMLLSYVLEGGLHGHGLDELTLLHLGRTNIKYSEVTGTGRNRIGFAEVPLDAALDYAAEDADVTLGLHNLFKPRLAQEHMTTVYETIERPLVAVLQQVEQTGIRVDAVELRRLSDDFDRRIGDLGDEIHSLAGHEFNIGSPKQLGEVLFDEMSLPGGKKGKTGAYGTGADVLEGLAAQGHDLPARVLDWRQLSKLKSTYTDALIGQINPETGRVHTSFAQAVTSTGRLSSSDPNLQNIPIRTEEGRKIRRAFIADAGHTLLSADYSQIELRLLAHVADITALKEAFRNGADIHAMTASEVFGIPVEGMESSVRNRAKAINFGIIYGISPFGLARQLAIPQAEAADYIKAYFEHYPGIQDYMERTKGFARTHGFVTTIFGRKCHTPGIKDRNPARRNFAERAAINAPLQGAAADIIKRAMIRMPTVLQTAGLTARMLLQVHDELVFEVPDKELEATAEAVRKVMEGAAHLSVPLVCETGTGPNWAEAH